MKSTTGVIIVCAILAVAVFNSCVRVEFKREVRVNNAKTEVAISRQGRVLCAITPEGAFPQWVEQISLHARSAIPDDVESRMQIPQDASARYDSIQSGEVRFDPRHRKALVRVSPSGTYHWLRLDGEYPLVFEK